MSAAGLMIAAMASFLVGMLQRRYQRRDSDPPEDPKSSAYYEQVIFRYTWFLWIGVAIAMAIAALLVWLF